MSGAMRAAGAVADRAMREGKTLTLEQQHAVAALSTDSWVYLWGRPGRGKTWLIDALAQGLGDAALRVHLHEFFAELHANIHRSGGLSGALAHLLGGREVVLFDEFTVHDPANGVFLDRVLRMLDHDGIRVIATSNREPDQLMPNPLFHGAFAPTIELIEQLFTVVSVDGPIDLRAAITGSAGFGDGRWVLEPDFPGDNSSTVELRPGGRSIRARQAGAVVIVDYADLCDAPTAATDYSWLADHFAYWRLTGIDVPPAVSRDSLARFAVLIDVAYDRDINVTISAHVTIDQFAEALTAELPDAARTVSRINVLAVG